MIKPASIIYGNEIIYYARRHRQQDNGKVLIKVHDNGSVVVHVPEFVADEAVKAAITKRAGWIWKQLEQVRQYAGQSMPRQHISGESHFYLGRRHLLKVIEAPASVPGVKLLRGKFQVTVRVNTADKVKTLLDHWYKCKAADVFHKRLNELLPQTPWVDTVPELRVQRMSKQWGSCSSKRVLTLNTHLVKAPRDCIDYVILHELCHLQEHNHSERFYRLLKTTMPDWEQRKARLDQQAFLYLW